MNFRKGVLTIVTAVLLLIAVYALYQVMLSFIPRPGIERPVIKRATYTLTTSELRCTNNPLPADEAPINSCIGAIIVKGSNKSEETIYVVKETKLRSGGKDKDKTLLLKLGKDQRSIKVEHDLKTKTALVIEY